MNVVRALRRNHASRTVIIIVPTIVLKGQWEKQLNDLNLSENTTVYVVNSLIKLKSLECKLLVIDEIHRVAATTFAKVFKVVNYSFILGLTATLKRLDGKHTILQKYAPIIDTISMAYCRAKGYVSQYKEYNLGITMPPSDIEWYSEKFRELGSMMDKFDNDFELMLKCSYSNKPQWSPHTMSWFEPRVVSHARMLGWRGDGAIQARQNSEINATKPRGQKLNVWGGEDSYFHPDKLYGFAIYGMRLIQDIKVFINTHPLKTASAIEIINRTNYETITFGENIKIVDDMKSVLGDKAVVYHSKVEGGVKTIEVTKTYKRHLTAMNYITNNHEWGYKNEIDGKYIISKFKEVRVSPKKLKEEAICKIMEDDTVKVMLTARALDQGFDYPGAELGIILSRTSSPTSQTQRTGRVVRKHTYLDGTEKTGLVVNLYLKDTKDANKLRAAQRNSVGVIEVSSIDEIMTREGLK